MKLLVRSQVTFLRNLLPSFRNQDPLDPAVKEPALQADFSDEKRLLKEYQPKSMNVLAGTSNDKPIMIEFGCELTPLSFDRKLTLQADTGADANAINKKTFNEVFPDVELEEST